MDLASFVNSCYQSGGHRAEWKSLGFPVVRLEHQSWCAAHALATISDEALGATCPPWPVFLIVPPPNWITIESAGSVRFALVGIGEHWNVELLHSHCGVFEAERGSVLESLDRSQRAEEARAARAILMLMIGISFECDKAGTAGGLVRASGGRARRRMANLGTNEYVAGKPLRVNHTTYFQDWMRTGDSSAMVTSWVRGHHKLQAHGPERTQRRKIFIEPYPRGEGPTLVREHII